jgi:hypothetical protein
VARRDRGDRGALRQREARWGRVLFRPVLTTAQRTRWIHSPAADVALAFCWVPFAIAAHTLEATPRLLGVLVAGVFLLSFAHQPLTMGLVYGDPVQFAARRRLYLVAPIAFATAILIGQAISLTLVALVAGLWNAEHTLMQRYGLTRIYGRKAGDDHGGLEKPMLISWLVLAAVWVAAFVDIDRAVQRIHLGGTNTRSVQLLGRLSAGARWLVVPVAALAAGLSLRWWRAERALGARANPAKHLYVAATAALIATIVVDPIAGLVAYVAAHALEYFVIVHRSLRGRVDDAPVAKATASPSGRAMVYVGYFVGLMVLLAVTYPPLGGHGYTFVILFFGALHILYDGFVWKLRRPTVAASLGVPSPIA